MPIWSWNGARLFLIVALMGGSALALPKTVHAHPHVWATVRSEIVFGPENKITGIKQAWTFDEFYSAMAVQGLDADSDGTYTKEELAELAKVNVDSLEEFDYFTFVREADEQAFMPLNGPEDYWIEYGDTVLTLHFTLPLKKPIDPGQKGVTVDVYDPAFFVAFGFAEKDPVKVGGMASSCTVKVDAPDAESAEAAKALSEAFFSQLGPSSNYGSQFAQTALVKCEPR